MLLFVVLLLVTTLAFTNADNELLEFGAQQFAKNMNISVTDGDVIYLECRLKCSEYIFGSYIRIIPPPGVFQPQTPTEEKCPMVTYMDYTANRHDSSEFSCDFYNATGSQQRVRINVRVDPGNADSSLGREKGIPGSLIVVYCVAVFAVISMLLMCYQQYNFKRAMRKRERESQEIRMQELRYDHGNLADFEIAESNVTRGLPLGEGNFGYVYSGYLKTSEEFTLFGCSFWFFTSKKAVAIKEPKPICTTWENETDSARETVLNELKVLCQIGSHPNIINLIGSVITERILVIVEKCDNGDLSFYLRTRVKSFVPQYQDVWTLSEEEQHDVLKERDTLDFGYRQGYNKDKWSRIIKSGLTTAHLLSFGLQIAKGMRYLVSRNCIHRDLAARNVLLTSDGVVKISDFGLSRRLREHDYYRSRTGVGHIKWMALEALETRITNVHTDIWSFGIVLVELFLLGADPYSKTKYLPPNRGPEDSHSQALLDFIRAGGRCEKPFYCPPLVYEHMLKCWSVDPNQRPNFSHSAEFLETHLRAASSELLEITENKISKENDNLRKYSDYRISKRPSANLEILSRSQKVSRAEHDGYRPNL